MALNVVSNFAANVAHRNLTMSDAKATSSLAKLSAGTRVVNAKDDAAAMAIGSRLSTEVAGLKQASVNAGQAVSMLQIADGAMARVQDILVRMKTLSVQAGSGQLSGVERGMLDTEYQNLLSEVDRIAADTEFNGNQLVNGDQVVGGVANYGVGDGVVSISARGFTMSTDTPGSATGTLDYDETNNSFSFNDGTNTYAGTINADALNGAGTASTMATGTQVQLTSTGSDAVLSLTLNLSFASGITAATDNITLTESSAANFTFKVGTGASSSDEISVSIDGIKASSLGIDGTDITSTSNADAASTAISNAIDTLNETRAGLGASQNRLEFAQANLATATENTEAARSSLIDLDVAAEMTRFTSQQILVQAGVSMMAQANQMPQNLLRLFN